MDPQVAVRLAVVEAKQEIQRLKARYAELVDARYTRRGPADATTVARLANEAAGLFSEDAEWDGGVALGVARGRDEIAARLRTPTLRFARHLFTNPQVHVDVAEDTATGRWDLLAPVVTGDGAGAWMVGVEHDVYRRIDGAWLHASMRLETTFVGAPDDAWGLPED